MNWGAEDATWAYPSRRRILSTSAWSFGSFTLPLGQAVQ